METLEQETSPLHFDEIRKRSKRPWGGPLKAATCFCCSSGTRLSNHHIEPRESGGSDSLRNKVTLCHTCHDAVEGMAWVTILARRDEIRTERYAKRYARPVEPGEKSWLGRTALQKVASIRRYCLTKGVFQNDGTANDFQQASRTVSRLYQELKGESGIITASTNDVGSGYDVGRVLLGQARALAMGGAIILPSLPVNERKRYLQTKRREQGYLDGAEAREHHALVWGEESAQRYWEGTQNERVA